MTARPTIPALTAFHAIPMALRRCLFCSLLLFSAWAKAAVLAEQKVLVPLTDGQQIAIPVNDMDPDAPYWVSMSLIAVSAVSDQAHPAGEVHLEMFPEGIPLSISIPQQFSLEAGEKTRLPRSDKLVSELEASLAALPSGELERRLGKGLVEAMTAYVAGNGQALGRTYVVHYPAPHRKGLLFRVKVKSRSGDFHPMVLQATLGQGDVPLQYVDFFAAAHAPVETPANPRALLALGSLIFLVFAYLFRRWRG